MELAKMQYSEGSKWKMDEIFEVFCVKIKENTLANFLKKTKKYKFIVNLHKNFKQQTCKKSS
jgi:hypothetical protein